MTRRLEHVAAMYKLTTVFQVVVGYFSSGLTAAARFCVRLLATSIVRPSRVSTAVLCVRTLLAD